MANSTASQAVDIEASLTSRDARDVDTTRLPVEVDPIKPTDDAVPSQDAQNGVQKMQAVTIAWSKKSLAGLLCGYVPSYIPPMTLIWTSH